MPMCLASVKRGEREGEELLVRTPFLGKRGRHMGSTSPAVAGRALVLFLLIIQTVSSPILHIHAPPPPPHPKIPNNHLPDPRPFSCVHQHCPELRPSVLCTPEINEVRSTGTLATRKEGVIPTLHMRHIARTGDSAGQHRLLRLRTILAEKTPPPGSIGSPNI
ncbi:hypothetical protein KP509_18G002900 [Ceratopteris richardii]|uniref:Uncharacterized protein n=1 Tax=Ceratopteris richardii TaxID=49495 RepID=A0A8T2SNQ4_CERRI|nr:hypothetical protein KP509_18G002900 [Ceratopteris richardii]